MAANITASMIGMAFKNQLELRSRSDMVTFVPSTIFISEIYFSFQHRHKQGRTSSSRSSYNAYFAFETSLIQIPIRKHKPEWCFPCIPQFLWAQQNLGPRVRLRSIRSFTYKFIIVVSVNATESGIMVESLNISQINKFNLSNALSNAAVF